MYQAARVQDNSNAPRIPPDQSGNGKDGCTWERKLPTCLEIGSVFEEEGLKNGQCVTGGSSRPTGVPTGVEPHNGEDSEDIQLGHKMHKKMYPSPTVSPPPFPFAAPPFFPGPASGSRGPGGSPRDYPALENKGGGPGARPPGVPGLLGPGGPGLRWPDLNIHIYIHHYIIMYV